MHEGDLKDDVQAIVDAYSKQDMYTIGLKVGDMTRLAVLNFTPSYVVEAYPVNINVQITPADLTGFFSGFA